MSASTELAVIFGCAGDALVGILHIPAVPAELGVVVIVGGPQYRAGSHRQFVLLARAIADAGFAVLRFDVRGMGDSAGAPRGFEDSGADIAAAIDTLQAQVPAVQRVALWGLCDGAAAALLYVDATHDQRVAGVCALNPWVRSDASLARTQLKHYYRQRMGTAEFWFKLMRGQVGVGALRELSRKILSVASRGPPPNAAAAPFPELMARGCETLAGGSVLVLLSDNDYTAKEFIEVAATSPRWQRVFEMAHVQRRAIAGADHTFSQSAARTAVDRGTVHWLHEMLSHCTHGGDTSYV